VAPEDIARGDHVTPLLEVTEWPSWFWCDGGLESREEPVRICHLPQAEPQPLRVLGVCLPFVLVKTASGEERTLDVRRCRLARLERRYAAAAWQVYRRRAKRNRKGLSPRR
jgi:hypothetical protein